MPTPFPLLEVAPPTDPGGAIGTLLSTFEPQDVTDPHWELGYQFPTWGACLSAFRWAPSCEPTDKDIGTGSTTVEAVPFTVLAPFRCSTTGTGGDLGEYEAAARQALKFMGGQQVEEELWHGTLAVAEGWPNLALTVGADMVGLSATDAYPWPVALALLQKDMRACLGDAVGVIHASPALVSLWQMAGAVKEISGVLRDVFGNFVIAGSGYDGSDPDGVITSGIEWAYGTGIVDIRIGEVYVLDPKQSVQRSTNTVELVAEATMSATWDGCCHHAVQASIADSCTFPGGDA